MYMEYIYIYIYIFIHSFIHSQIIYKHCPNIMLFQMVAATVVTTAITGSTPTVVIANPANAHLSLPIGKINVTYASCYL